jgi:hypothetical protein
MRYGLPYAALVWLLIPALGFLAIVSACSSDDVSAPFVPSVPVISLAQLQNAPLTLDLSPVSSKLTAHLDRNFMPTIPPAKSHPLFAIVQLASLDQQPLPEDVAVRYIWVINDGSIWSTALVASSPTDKYTLTALGGGGPEWKTGSTVDVVVGITVGKSLRLVRLPDQVIHRVE